MFDAIGLERGERLMADIFSEQVVSRLERVRRPDIHHFDTASLPVRRRHEVVRTTTPEPWRGGFRYKRAWCAYLDAAEDCGLLDDPEIRAALVGVDDDAFRAAMAECLVAFHMQRVVGATLQPKPDGKATKQVDFGATLAEFSFFCEVKAPHVARSGRFFGGDDARTIRSSVISAGEQCKKRRCNVVVLVPTLRIDVFSSRSQLVKALIGEQALSVFVSLDGSPPREPEPTFLQRGKLAALHVQKDGTFKTDYTRVSAVACIDEYLFDGQDDFPELGHRVVVAHNPFAEAPLPSKVFAPNPQLVVSAPGEMTWTDGKVDDGL